MLLDIGKGFFFSNSAQDVDDISNQKPPPVLHKRDESFDGVLSDFGEGVTEYPSRL